MANAINCLFTFVGLNKVKSSGVAIALEYSWNLFSTKFISYDIGKEIKIC